MSPPKIKLIYFNVRGAGEIIRLVLAQAGVEYEDFRIKHEDWPELKKSMPTGQLPVMEYNGELLAQSMAIARFLAREYKLAGKSSWETAKVDMISDTISDVGKKFYPIYMEKDAEKKKELTDKYIAEDFAVFAKNIEAILIKNGGKFMVGDGVTLADIQMAYALDMHCVMVDPSSAWKKDAPHLDKLMQHVLGLPNIKRWIEKRPVTDH